MNISCFASHTRAAHFIRITLCFLGLTILIGLINIQVIQQFPNSADEYAYIFQAKNFGLGKIYSKPHAPDPNNVDLRPFFEFAHIGDNDDKYYGKYPPGYSLLLMFAQKIGAPFNFNLLWLINAIFGAITIILIYSFGTTFFSNRIGLIAATIATFNPWFLLTSASYYSHTTFLALCFLGQFFFLKCTTASKPEFYNGLLAGISLGLASTIRTTEIALLAPAMAWSMASGLRHHSMIRRLSVIGSLALGVIPGLFAVTIYNKLLTGEYFLNPYNYYSPNSQNNCPIFYNPTNHTWDFSRILYSSIPITWRQLKELLAYFPLCLLALFPTNVRHTLSTTQLHVKIFFSILVLSILVFHLLVGIDPVQGYGPRYYYLALPCLSILIALSCTEITKSLRPSITAILGSAIVLVAFTSIIQRFTYHFNQIYDRQNLFRTIKEGNLSNAVVYISTNSGDMAPIDLVRNANDFTNSVILSHYLADNTPMLRAYTNLRHYKYSYIKNSNTGLLEPIK